MQQVSFNNMNSALAYLRRNNVQQDITVQDCHKDKNGNLVIKVKFFTVIINS